MKTFEDWYDSVGEVMIYSSNSTLKDDLMKTWNDSAKNSEYEIKYLKNSEAILANNVGKLYSELSEIKKELYNITTNIEMIINPKNGMATGKK